MQQRIVHGAFVDILTPDEFYKAIPRPPRQSRIRAPQGFATNAAGAGSVDLYKVTLGSEFEARRIFVDIDGSTSPATGNFLLNGANTACELLRSGQRVEYLLPAGPSGVPQIPGVVTWGAEQGPYLRNGEILSIRVLGIPGFTRIMCLLEGILTENRLDA